MSGSQAPDPGAELELAGTTASSEAIGERVEQRTAGAVGVDQVGVEVDPESAGQIAGTVSEPVHRTSVGVIVAGAAGQHLEPDREVGRQLVRAASEQVAFVDQHGERTTQWGRLGDEHSSQARMHGQAEHPAADVGEVPLGVDRTEVGPATPRRPASP